VRYGQVHEPFSGASLHPQRLGEKRLFRGSVDRKSGAEKIVLLSRGRMLTSVGLNCTLNDVNRIKARSPALCPTALQAAVTTPSLNLLPADRRARAER
jgi:hypothetical protein